MECQPSDSKTLFNVFDASKSKRTRKKCEGLNDSNSVATDDSTSGCQPTVRHVASTKASLQEFATSLNAEGDADNKRNRDSSPSVSRSPGHGKRRSCRSPRRHRRSTWAIGKEKRPWFTQMNLAGGLRPKKNRMFVKELLNDRALNGTDGILDSIPQDQDSFIYAFLEEAIVRDKKRHRHSKRREERRASHEREASPPSRDHRHHRRRHRDEYTSKDRTRDRSKKGSATIDQTVLFETFAKLCAQLNEKNNDTHNKSVPRTLSHKSLQCEVVPKQERCDTDQQPVRLRSNEQSRENVSKTRSHDNFRRKLSSDKISHNRDNDDNKCSCYYDKGANQFSSKVNIARSRMRNVDDDRYLSYPPEHLPSRNLDNYRSRTLDTREYRDYDRDYAREKHYEIEKRKYYDQKTNRSYDVNKCGYPEDDKFYRRTARSDVKEKHYDDRERYYDDKKYTLDARDHYSSNRQIKRNIDRCDRNSVVSRDDDYRDRCSERERDSGLSVADGETSTISGKSNYLRVVKQEIAEQRETMDKMMKLWKELMRCFKGLSSTQVQNKSVHDSAANAQESAAAQLRLWRECMRRYETVARDVGDTDARLMEEINKQRSEMSEMASMWQECLQRYREISSDFNNLKQQVTSTKQQQLYVTESPTRLTATPLACAEGEGTVPSAHYRVPPHYPQMGPVAAGYGGSPLRPRASAPPAWWWCEGAQRSPRRRSSPESRGSRDRRRRHKERDREDSRYKEKSSKPNGARSEHRHRKR